MSKTILTSFLNKPISHLCMIGKVKSVKQEKSEKSEKSVKQVYIEFQKQFDLPDFDSLNAEFELSSIECEPEFLLRNIIKKFAERLNFFQDIFNNVLNPDLGS